MVEGRKWKKLDELESGVKNRCNKVLYFCGDFLDDKLDIDYDYIDRMLIWNGNEEYLNLKRLKNFWFELLEGIFIGIVKFFVVMVVVGMRERIVI